MRARTSVRDALDSAVIALTAAGCDTPRLDAELLMAHALADQRHPLGKFMKQPPDDDDATTARQAVTEGQATWLTWAYMAKRAGGKPEVPAAMIDELIKQTGASGEEEKRAR